MTPENASIHPEYWLHDDCLPDEFKDQPVEVEPEIDLETNLLQEQLQHINEACSIFEQNSADSVALWEILHDLAFSKEFQVLPAEMRNRIQDATFAKKEPKNPYTDTMKLCFKALIASKKVMAHKYNHDELVQIDAALEAMSKLGF